MLTSFFAAEDTAAADNPILNIAVFVAFIVVTIFVVTRVGKGGNKGASSFYIGDTQLSGTQNGLVVAGNYLSAASFLGTVDAVALTGYDGSLYSIGFFVAWLVALSLVTKPLHNVDKFTIADVLSFRPKQRPVRTAAAISTLAMTLFYLITQIADAGSLVAVLLNIHDPTQQSVVVAVVDITMVAYILISGMKGMTYAQVIKAVLLVGAVIIMILIILVGVKGNFSQLLQDAVDMHASSDHIAEKGCEASTILESDLEYSGSFIQQLDFVFLGLALVLGVAGLPHVLIRFYTVPTTKETRKSVTWAIILVDSFYLLTLVSGYGATALVDPDQINTIPGGANAATPLLASEFGGFIFMVVVSAVAFVTMLAMVADLVITASASVGQGLYQAVIRKGQATEAEQVRVSRITVIVLGVVTITLGILAMDQNVAFLMSLAFVVVTSANVPTILMSLLREHFSTAGAVASVYTGVITSLVLIIFSSAVSGSESSMAPSVDFSWFPLTSSGLFVIPLTFLADVIATHMSRPDNFDGLAAEMEVHSLTGVGAEAAVDHQ